MFLADNIGSNISVSSIGNTLVNEGLLENGKRKGTPSVHTVQAYVNALLESYFSTTSKDLISKERNIYALLANTILSISDFETICLDSEIVTAVMQ